MGTSFECVLGAFAHPVSLSQSAAIAEGVEQRVRDEHDRLSLFDPASIISRINREAAHRSVPLDPDLFDLLKRCERYARSTGRAFDITAGALMHANGFRGAHAAPTNITNRFSLDPSTQTIRLTPGTQLDLGAVAKGFALDLIRDELTEHAVTSAIVHGGTSSITTIGRAPDGSPWRVRLMADDPDAPDVELTDVSLACSSPSGRTANGVGHIMDTRTGQPADTIHAACVVGPSAEVCEAWSTALCVDPGLARALPAGYLAHINRDHTWTTNATIQPVPSTEALTHA